MCATVRQQGKANMQQMCTCRSDGMNGFKTYSWYNLYFNPSSDFKIQAKHFHNELCWFELPAGKRLARIFYTWESPDKP